MKKSRYIILSTFVLLLVTGTKSQIRKASYSEGDISQKAEILRNKEDKTASLQIECAGAWRLYAGPSVQDIDFSKPVFTGMGSGIFTLDVPVGTRSYFQLESDCGHAILAERQLPMTGGYNFRDLGGYRNREGKYVKWGKIFRSDDLYHLTEQDLTYLSSIPLVSIVDFRSEGEMERAPDKTPASVEKSYICCMNPGDLSGSMDFLSYDKEQLHELMRGMNRILVTDSVCVAQYRKLFELLQDESKVPLMYHCSAGKDRTGMATALILYALGVDREVILQDYLSSNRYLDDKYTPYIERYPNLQALFEVKSEFLLAGFEQIEKSYGSVDKFLTEVLCVNIERMRERYLENDGL